MCVGVKVCVNVHTLSVCTFNGIIDHLLYKFSLKIFDAGHKDNIEGHKELQKSPK